jgi:hypothetical protein
MASFLKQLLAYMDTPWKAMAIFILAITFGVGWTLYERRAELIEAFLTPSEIELKVADIPVALDKLTTDTDADLIQIWAVDLGENSQRFIAARRHDGERPIIPSPRRLPIIVTVSDVRALIAILEGHPICVDLSPLGSPLARRLAERGMRRGCAIPIPPTPDKFVGVIYLAWKNPVDETSENVAVTAAREIAGSLVNK